MKTFSLIISCGGTGGHFYPGLSIARECKKQDIPVRLYVAGKHSKSQKDCAAGFGIEADIGRAIRLPQQKWKLPFFTLVFLWTTIISFFYLLKHKPKAVLVMGSFASVPLGLAAAMTFTPLYLHEGNTVVGRANRLLSRWGRRLFLSFPVINRDLVKCPAEEIGMPVRPEIEAFESSGKEQCGMSTGLPLIMVFGGSQGALKINNALYGSLEFIKEKFQLIHLTGQPDNSEYSAKAEAAGIAAKIETSTDKMADYFQAADLIVCRAGASSLAEIALFGKPVIFIPLKIAAENHQFHNAQVAVKADAAEIIIEDDLSAEVLANKINALLAEKDKLTRMSANMADLCRKEVAQKLVKTLITSC